jgi:hypothetical protein
VIAAIVVKLPMISRPVAVPVLARLVIKGTSSASRLWLARRMAQLLAGALPGRRLHVVADAAYAGGELKKLPSRLTWTTRLRKHAALYALPPQRTGKRGRPRARGDKLASLARLAATAAFAPVTVTRYGTTATVQAATPCRSRTGINRRGVAELVSASACASRVWARPATGHFRLLTSAAGAGENARHRPWEGPRRRRPS